MRTSFRCFGLLAGLALGAASPALAGPPWISVETPVNPYNQETRDGLFLVRVYHHGNPAFMRLTGTAEGLVGTDRRTVPLDLKETKTPGLWTVRYRPAQAGAWLLVFRIGEEKDYAGATMLVTLGKDGAVSSARVPTRQGEGGWTIPDRVTRTEIDALLKAQLAASDGSPSHHGGLVLLGVLTLAPLGLVGRRFWSA